MQNLNETWVGGKYFLRDESKLKEIKIFNDITAYESIDFNEILLEIIKNSSKKSIAPAVKYLLDKGYLKVIWVDKNYLSQVYNAITSTVSDFFTTKRNLHDKLPALGTFKVNENKIYIFIQQSINMLGFADDEAIAATVAHEMAHFIWHNRAKLVYASYKTELYDWYFMFFKFYFNFDDKHDKKIQALATVYANSILRFEITKNENTMNNSINRAWQKLIGISGLFEYSNFKHEQFNYEHKKLLLFYKHTFMEGKFDKESYRDIYMSCLAAYNYIGITNVRDYNIGLYQELLFPSEIFSVASECDYRPKIATLLKTMVMGL